VALLLTKQVVTGFLINNLWSFAGDDNRAAVNAIEFLHMSRIFRV